MTVHLPGRIATHWTEPKILVEKLAKTSRAIRRKFKSGELLQADFRDIALRFLDDSEAVPPQKRWMVFQYAYTRFSERGNRRIADDESKLLLLLHAFKEDFREYPSLRNQYFRLLRDGYFSHGEPEKVRPEQERGPVRKLLKGSLADLKSGEDAPEWVLAMRKYPSLLSTDACADLVPLFNADDPSELNQVLDNLALPAEDWIRALLHVRWIEEMTREQTLESDFKRAIPRIIQIAGAKYSALAIPLLLNRYYLCQSRPPHQELLAYVTRHWGSVYDPKAAAWAEVSADVRKMVRNWLNGQLLEWFFRAISSGIAADVERLEFMKRYLGGMDQIKIALIESDRTRRGINSELWRVRNEYPSQFAILDDANASALIVQTGPYIWIEFLGEGNAGYIYRASDCRFSMENKRYSGSTALYGLKFGYYNRHLALVRTVHNIGWQSSLAYQLAGLGVQPSRDYLW